MSRTEQLGLPIPRKLTATKQEFDHILEKRKLQNLDKHLEKSLNTIYCKMVAQKRRTSFSRIQQKRKATLSNNEYEKWLKNIAKPKKIFEPETMERAKGKIDINRMIRLSQPRHRPYPERDLNNITEATLNYEATERILYLAQPRKEVDVVCEIQPISFPVHPQYAAVKSLGIDKLSVPLRRRDKYLKVTTDVRCSYTPVSKNALKYEASVKIKKLAAPKTAEEDELGDVYKVKKKALMKLPKKMEKIFTKMSTPIEWKVTPKFEPN